MTSRRLALLTVTLATLASSSTAAAQTPALPDLITKEPENFRIAHFAGGAKRLLFDNEVGNRGLGDLRITDARPRVYGPADAFFVAWVDCQGRAGAGFPAQAREGVPRRAMQIIPGADPASWTAREIGCLVFDRDPYHQHWHLDDFAGFELRSCEGDVCDGPPVASTKTGFCLVDINRIPYALGHPPQWQFGGRACGFRYAPDGSRYWPDFGDIEMGISRAWSDEYVAGTAHQDLDLQGLADGQYCFVSRADPVNRILEASPRADAEANNGASVLITLSYGLTQVRARPNTECGGVGSEPW